MVEAGINGFGRIGRLILRALLENYKSKIQVVGINDLGSIEANAHLIKFDSTHGTLNHEVKTTKEGFQIGDQNIKVFAERDPSKLPWGKIGADVVKLQVYNSSELVIKKSRPAHYQKKIGKNQIPSGNNLMISSMVKVFGGIPKILPIAKDKAKDIEKILNSWKITKNQLFSKTKIIWSKSFRPSNTNKDLVGSGFDT